ncbi:hypothetical protein VTI28DRAFT_6234 [Corynascus sepedonium]
MELLQAQLKEVDRFNATRPYQHHVSARMVQDALIELARSMYDYGTVPDSLEASPSSSEDRLKPPRTHFRRPVLPQENQRVTITRSRSPTVTTNSTRSTSRSSHTSPIPSPIPSPISYPPLQRRRSPRPPPRSQLLPRLQLDPAEANNPSHLTDLCNIIHHLPAHLLTHAVTGYISSPTRTCDTPKCTNPFLVPTLACNIISLREARRLGLEVQPPHDGGVSFDFGEMGAERSVGRTELLWSGSLVNDKRCPPLTVGCEVYENVNVGLVLGQPFLKERKRWWLR